MLWFGSLGFVHPQNRIIQPFAFGSDQVFRFQIQPEKHIRKMKGVLWVYILTESKRDKISEKLPLLIVPVEITNRSLFGIPFKWFVDDDERPTEKKTKQLQKTIALGGYDKYFTLRSYMTFKVVITLVMLLIGGFFLLVIQYWDLIASLLFAVESEPVELSLGAKGAIVSAFLVVGLIPNFVLKSKVKTKLKNDAKDIPVLQMFIILMLRSNKTIAEILYALSKVNTPHKEVFEKSYRVYLRNKGEGMDFLKRHFHDSRFVDTFNLLEDIGEYARNETIRILENNLHSIVEETAMIKRRNDMSRLIFSQASMIIPFVSVMALGAIPLIVMGLTIFSASFGGAGF